MNNLVDLDVSDKFNELVKNVLNKKWPKDESEESIFKFIFDCNPFLKVFIFMERSVKKKEHEAKEVQIISLLDATLRDIRKGTIKLSLLGLLYSNRKVLKEMLELFSESLDSKFWTNPKEMEAMIDKIFEFRLSEVEIVAKFTKNMENLYYMMRTTDFFSKGLFKKYLLVF